MTTQNPPSPHAGGSPVDLTAALKAAEATLRGGGTPSARALDELRALTREHPAHAKRVSRRVDQVFATAALRTRDVPSGLLDGLYADVRAAAADQHRGRARMSTAFLDAPKNLVVWRRLAVAASLLFAVGVFWTTTRDADQTTGSRSRPLAADEDPRWGVLEPARPGDALTQPAGLTDTRRPRGARSPAGYRFPTVFFDGWSSDPGAARPPRVPAPEPADGEERN